MAATVEQLAGSAHLLHSAACLLAGDLATALSSVQRFLANYAGTAREEDCCLAYAQLAFSAAERQGNDAAAKVPCSSPSPISLPPNPSNPSIPSHRTGCLHIQSSVR